MKDVIDNDTIYWKKTLNEYFSIFPADDVDVDFEYFSKIAKEQPKKFTTIQINFFKLAFLNEVNEIRKLESHAEEIILGILKKYVVQDKKNQKEIKAIEYDQSVKDVIFEFIKSLKDNATVKKAGLLIHWAVFLEQSDDVLIEIISKNRKSINPTPSVSKTLRTPLVLASELGYLRIVRLLINNGANIQVTTKTFAITAYACALRSDRQEVAQYLLQQGASPIALGSHVNWGGTTPTQEFHFTLQYGNAEVVKAAIVQARAQNISLDLDNLLEYLIDYYDRMDIESIKVLLEFGANPNLGFRDMSSSEKTKQSSTISEIIRNLHTANFYKYKGLDETKCIEIINLLSEYNVNLNAQKTNGSTALHIAIENGNTLIALRLIELNIGLGFVNNAQQTALDLACSKENKRVVEELLMRDAPTNKKPELETTSLQIQNMLDCKNKFSQAWKSNTNVGLFSSNTKGKDLLAQAYQDDSDLFLKLMQKKEKSLSDKEFQQFYANGFFNCVNPSTVQVWINARGIMMTDQNESETMEVTEGAITMPFPDHLL